MIAMVSACRRPLKLKRFPCSLDSNLHDNVTKLNCMVLGACLALQMNAEKDPRMQKFFSALFRAGKVFVASIQRSKLLETVSESACR